MAHLSRARTLILPLFLEFILGQVTGLMSREATMLQSVGKEDGGKEDGDIHGSAGMVSSPVQRDGGATEELAHCGSWLWHPLARRG
jgi:hypothetical protein